MTRASIVAGRLRASTARLRGMRIGAKTMIGRRLESWNASRITIGARCTIEHDVYLKIVAREAHLSIGDFTFVGRGCELDVALSVSIGKHTLIAPGVFITDHGHEIGRDQRIDEQGIHAAPVVIGSDVWIGTRSVILAGVSIGDGAVIGAGSIVRENVEPFTIVAGVPARQIGQRE